MDPVAQGGGRELSRSHPGATTAAGWPLFLVNRSGNRPSHEGAAVRFDQAVHLGRRAGFKRITLRGDTDFSQTEHLDRWHEDDVRFIFGFDANATLVNLAQQLPEQAWKQLEREPKYEVKSG